MFDKMEKISKKKNRKIWSIIYEIFEKMLKKCRGNFKMYFLLIFYEITTELRENVKDILFTFRIKFQKDVLSTFNVKLLQIMENISLNVGEIFMKIF